jgi:MraZ protein
MNLKTGSAESTLDDKGRVSIPVRFREQFQGELVIAWGIEQCVYIMKPAAWGYFEQNLRNPEMYTQEERRILENKHLHQAQIVEIDKAGRIAIPPTFRKYANLTRDCMVISAEERLSIWDIATFDAYLAENDAIARAAINKLGSKDIFRAG